MELAVLNDQFRPKRLVEDHTSLVWAERYSAASDFQRDSEDIGGTLQKLPLYTVVGGVQVPTVVSLRDSDVPMIVETHKITKPLNGPPKIVTTGRSFETVLDRRTTIKSPLGTAKIQPWTSSQKTAVDAAYEALNRIVTLGEANLADQIPEIDIKPPIRPAGYNDSALPVRNIQVDPGELYSWVLGQIQTENYALRAVRPKDLSTSKVSIEIYTGTDRTTEIVFDARFDQFDNAEYLLSQAAWKNTSQVGGATDSVEVTDGNTYTGLNRRVSYFDGSQITTGLTGSTLDDAMTNLGKVDLAKQLETALFMGEVSRQMGSLYGKDYFLGDIVKLTGNYGLSQFVRISEFIRSEDNTGEKAYPTFASL